MLCSPLSFTRGQTLSFLAFLALSRCKPGSGSSCSPSMTDFLWVRGLFSIKTFIRQQTIGLVGLRCLLDLFTSSDSDAILSLFSSTSVGQRSRLGATSSARQLISLRYLKCDRQLTWFLCRRAYLWNRHI